MLQNIDDLFEREELSAAPDLGWPDCFNSGVFVYVPSLDTYRSLLDFALSKGSFDGGDQVSETSIQLQFVKAVFSSNALFAFLPF